MTLFDRFKHIIFFIFELSFFFWFLNQNWMFFIWFGPIIFLVFGISYLKTTEVRRQQWFTFFKKYAIPLLRGLALGVSFLFLFFFGFGVETDIAKTLIYNGSPEGSQLLLLGLFGFFGSILVSMYFLLLIHELQKIFQKTEPRKENSIIKGL